MPDEKPPITSATLQAALAPLIAMALTAGAVRMGVETKSAAESVIPISLALAALGVAGYNALLTHLSVQKAKKSEILAPGLTKVEIPEGMELKVTTALNDPKTPDPPTILTETTTKAGSLPEVKPMKVLKQLLFSLVCVACAFLGLGGCSNLTPNQRLHAGEVGYVAADVALTAADAAGKVPAPAKPQIQAGMADFAQRLTDAQTWVDANPTLADTPGYSPPSLDALDIARAAIRKYVIRFGLFAPLPAVQQPATTRPG